MKPHAKPALTESRARTAPSDSARENAMADTVRAYLARNGALAVLYAYDPQGDGVLALARSLAQTGPERVLALHAGTSPPPLAGMLQIALQPGAKLTAPMVAAAIDHLPSLRDKLLIVAAPIFLTGADLGESLQVLAAPPLMAKAVGPRYPMASATARILLPARGDSIAAATADCPQHRWLRAWLATLASP
jgi:hypothetical protein